MTELWWDYDVLDKPGHTNFIPELLTIHGVETILNEKELWEPSR
jgi:hypothetical protein